MMAAAASTAARAGYSGTPLPKKLGLKDGQAVAFVDLPGDLGWLRTSRAFAQVAEPAWGALPERTGFDVLQVFATVRVRLEASAAAMMAAIGRDGMIWVCWPKKSSKVETDITEDVLREVLLPIGLVDVKVCAVDDTWSGLKFVIRKRLR